MKDTTKIFIISLVISIALYLLGFYTGKIVAQSLYAETENDLLRVYNYVFELQTLNDMAKHNLCDTEIINSASLLVSSIGRYLGTLETTMGKDNEKVLLLKEAYTAALLDLYTNLGEYNKNCNYSYISILFFYSNKDEYYDISQKQGAYLDYVVYKMYPYVKVFAIESELINSPLITLIKSKYNITTIPALVISNGKTYKVVYGLKTSNEIIDIINNLTVQAPVVSSSVSSGANST